MEVIDAWVNPATGRPAAIPNERLAGLSRELLPVHVEGDAIQYQVNHTSNGWVVELVNNRGVSKKKDQAAVTDAGAVAHVTLVPRMRCASIREWRSGRVHTSEEAVYVEVGPGATEFIELVTQR